MHNTSISKITEFTLADALSCGACRVLLSKVRDVYDLKQCGS